MDDPRGETDLVEVEARVAAVEGERIALSRNGGESVWCPIGQIERVGHGLVTLPVWLAREKGFL